MYHNSDGPMIDLEILTGYEHFLFSTFTYYLLMQVYLELTTLSFSSRHSDNLSTRNGKDLRNKKTYQ